jgi:deferrochelatase/peroxidase EfeB
LSHALVTIIAAVPSKDIASLRTSIAALGNPAIARLAAALGGLNVIHFASLNVFEASAGGRGHLVFEFSGDGSAEELLRLLDQQLGADLGPVFAHAEDRGAAPLLDFWRSHIVETGQTLLANPGLGFAGTPGLSVERIRRERGLALHLADLLHRLALRGPALERVETIRKQLRADAKWSWALAPEPVAEGGTLEELPETLAASLPILARLAGPFVRDFLWPLAIPAGIAFAILWWMQGFTGKGFLSALACAGVTAVLTLVVAAVAAIFVYRAFRRREDAEVPVDRPAQPQAVAAIMQRENYAAQNHLAALSVMKPGRLRRFTLRVAFWTIGQLSTRYFRPGFLGALGTINFARWVMVPGTGDLLFLSNYGGSWESYLEDFITKAHAGLTGVWSNTVDFPKTSNLFQDGATDGERFKHWARRQQIPTAFWYTAYPELTTSNIRTNALIRQGLATAMTEDEARRWLALFGSEAQPTSALESNEIQSLIFGGLGFLHEGSALLFGLAEDRAASKAWLSELLPNIRFSDGRTWPCATILGLTASGLRKLGLPEDSAATFPAAFIDGMAAPWRARALGDVGANAPETWRWGGDPEDGIDGVLLLYAKLGELDRLRRETTALLEKRGHSVRRTIPFRPLPGPDQSPAQHLLAKCEPFGFVDGISQPVIRGTYKALRGADPIHIVEAGEFILGYPDNRGYMPPSPTLAAIHDPTSLLPPVASAASPDFGINSVNNDRDLGRNGSFLAIRQLEQHVDLFWSYCEEQGKRLEGFFPPGVQAPPEEFIAAKIVGRWRDGSPLVRYPRFPANDAPVPTHPLLRASAGIAASPAQLVTQIPAAPAPALRVQRSAGLAEEAAKMRSTTKDPSDAGRRQGEGRAKSSPNFEADNDFLFGAEDPQGLRCPFGAHIRRANPRESFAPGSQEQIEITNRHRIIRVGRFYEPEPGQQRGLFFMCLNGDIERQFEFVQQTWIQSSTFHGLSGEGDPLIGERSVADTFTVPNRVPEGPMRLPSLPLFVHTLGGGYFFLPGRRTIEYLSSDLQLPFTTD